jgi:hypothetical protein
MSATPHEVSLSPRPTGSERRRHPRYPVSFRLLMRWLECDDCHEELIRAEDVSRHGARLVVRSPLACGETVFVQAWNGDGFESRAQVRRVYIGRDGQTRLGVEFIDSETPDHLLAGIPTA